MKESNNDLLDGYYIKKHLIKSIENQFVLNNLTQKSYIDNTKEGKEIKIEDFKKIQEELYSEKIKNILIDNFELFLEEYYSQEYKHEIIDKNDLINYYYFSALLNYSEGFIKIKSDYISELIKKGYKIDNFAYEKIMELKMSVDSISNIIYKNNGFYWDISYLNNRKILSNSYLDNFCGEEFIKRLFLLTDFKNSFLYNNDIYNTLELYVNSKLPNIYNANIYNSDKIFYLNEFKNCYSEINSTLNNITEYFLDSTKDDYKNILYLFKKLKNQCDNLEITNKFNLNNTLFEQVIEEIENIYIKTETEKIINEYSELTKSFKESFKPIILQLLNDKLIFYWKYLHF